MKEYKLKINGNDYNVVINDVQESVASIEVNGSNYKVEFEKPIVKPTAIKVVKTATAAPAVSAAAPKPTAAPAPTAGGTTVSSSRSHSRRYNRILSPSRRYPGSVREGRRHRKERPEDYGSRGYEDGERSRGHRRRCYQEY